jgi:hypothetical protein
VIDLGLGCGANLCGNSQQNLNRIYAAIVRGKLEAAADFKHGENIRKRDAFDQPMANRSGIGNQAPMRSGFVS